MTGDSQGSKFVALRDLALLPLGKLEPHPVADDQPRELLVLRLSRDVERNAQAQPVFVVWRQLAGELGGTAVTLDELRADSIAGLVKDVQRRAA